MFPLAVLAAIVLGLLGAAYYVFVQRKKETGLQVAAPIRTGGGFKPQAISAAALRGSTKHRQNLYIHVVDKRTGEHFTMPLPDKPGQL